MTQRNLISSTADVEISSKHYFKCDSLEPLYGTHLLLNPLTLTWICGILGILQITMIFSLSPNRNMIELKHPKKFMVFEVLPCA